MMRRNGVLMPVAALLGAFAIAFSFIAYAKRIKDTDIVTNSNGHCVYPSSTSPALGIIAALLLLAEQIVIRAATNCFCCCGLRCSACCTVIASLLLFICSWLAFVLAFVGLIYTAMLNDRSYLAKAYPGNNGDDCKQGIENYFLGDALWCIITTVLSLLSSTLWVYGASKANNNSKSVAVRQTTIAASTKITDCS